MHYKLVFYKTLLIILENSVKLNNEIRENPTYENLRLQLFILFENIFNDFETNINSQNNLIEKIINDFEQSNLLHLLINLNKFINYVLTIEK